MCPRERLGAKILKESLITKYMNSITASDSSNGFYLISGKKYTETQIKESTRKMAGVRWK